MNIQKWQLKIVDSWLHMTHGMSYPAIEYYIPELNLSINNQHCFLGVDSRYNADGAVKLSEIEMNPEFVSIFKNLKESIEAREKAVENSRNALQSLFHLEKPEEIFQTKQPTDEEVKEVQAKLMEAAMQPNNVQIGDTKIVFRGGQGPDWIEES